MKMSKYDIFNLTNYGFSEYGIKLTTNLVFNYSIITYILHADGDFI